MIVRPRDADRQRAVEYLAKKLKTNPSNIVTDDLYEVFVICGDGNRPQGAVLYKNYSSGDIEMICGGEPGWVTRSMLKFVLGYPFEQLNCNRITCLAAKSNKAMRDYLVRMGFKLEGTKRKALHGKDLMIYGLLKGEAKQWVS